MRALLRRLIIWALGAVETPPADPSDLDRYAATAKADKRE